MGLIGGMRGRCMEGKYYTKRRAGESRPPFSLRSLSADRQARIAVALITVMPALAFFYIGLSVAGADGVASNPFVSIFILLAILIVAGGGWMVLRKYSKNITRLRKYVVEIASGTRLEKVNLYRSDESDDLKCIETGLNMIMQEMEKRIALIEQKLKVESGLRRALEQQQQVLLEAERHRVMLQSLGAACHHLGQPATALRLRLHLLRERARTIDEMEDVDDSIRDMEAIESILKKLREVNEYRTEPYLHSGESGSPHILAI